MSQGNLACKKLDCDEGGKNLDCDQDEGDGNEGDEDGGDAGESHKVIWPANIQIVIRMRVMKVMKMVVMLKNVTRQPLPAYESSSSQLFYDHNEVVMVMLEMSQG